MLLIFYRRLRDTFLKLRGRYLSISEGCWLFRTGLVINASDMFLYFRRFYYYIAICEKWNNFRKPYQRIIIHTIHNLSYFLNDFIDTKYSSFDFQINTFHYHYQPLSLWAIKQKLKFKNQTILMNRSLITHFFALYFFLLFTASGPFHLINKSAFLFSNSSSSFVHSTHESPLKTLSKSDKLPDTLSNLLRRVGSVVWYSLAKRRRISAISSEVNGWSEMVGFWISACIVMYFLMNFFNYKWAVSLN